MSSTVVPQSPPSAAGARASAPTRPAAPPSGGPARDGGATANPGPPAAISAATAPAGGPAAPVAPAAPKRRNPVPLIIAAVLLVVLGVWGYSKWRFAQGHVSTDNAQIQGDVIPVLPKVSGYVAEVRAVENQQVKAGDTLVVIDDRDLAAKLEQTEADLAAAVAQVGTDHHAGQAEAQAGAARANVAEAQAAAWKAHQDVDRYRGLAQQGVIGRQQLDAAEAAARTADAQVAAARENARASDATVTWASARVAAARAARDQAALQESYTRLVAPASGVVSKKDVEVGQLVQIGQPLMSVVPLEDVWVVANLKETEVRDVRPGEHVDVRVDSYPGRVFSGTVESLSPASGARFSLLPPDNATGNFTKVVQRIPVRVHLDHGQDPQHVLRPGMSVAVVITTKAS